MITDLKNIAIQNNWHFEYGRADFHNLYDAESKAAVHVFLDPVQTRQAFSPLGAKLSDTYSGRFMLLQQSHPDEAYHNNTGTGRYEKTIKPLVEQTLPVIQDRLACLDYEILEWNTTEVINMFDFNADGVIVQFSLKQEL